MGTKTKYLNPHRFWCVWLAIYGHDLWFLDFARTAIVISMPTAEQTTSNRSTKTDNAPDRYDEASAQPPPFLK